MNKKSIEKSTILKLLYFCLGVLLLSVPMMFTVHTGNPFYIIKNDALRIFGTIFILLSSALLFLKIKNEKFQLVFDKEFDPYIGLFFITSIISTIFSVNPSISYSGYYTRPLGLDVFLYIFLIYIFSSALLKNHNSISRLMFVMEICAAIISLYSILQYLGSDPFNIQPQDIKRPFGTMGNSVFLGGFLVLVFPFSLMRVVQTKKLNFTLLLPLMILIAIIFSQTRTAYAAVIVELSLIIFIYPFVIHKDYTILKKRLLYALYLFVGIVIFLILLIIFDNSNIFVKRLVNILSIRENPRWLLWREALKVFFKYPVTGCGISAFPLVFEDLYSLDFKLFEVRFYFDNAHNNFIHTLCTMGSVGFFAYLLLLGHSIYILFKCIFSKTQKPKNKMVYIGFLAMILGYIVYGIADFDEISIMFYFFIYLALLKSIYILDNNPRIYWFPINQKEQRNKAILLFSILFIFTSYNSYLSINQIIADSYYKKAFSLAAQSKFNASLDYFASAIDLWQSNTYYHYQYGAALLSYATSDFTLNQSTKYSILEKARYEFLYSANTYPSKKDCISLVCMSDYEMGDTAEAVKIKDELLGKDSLMVNFRLLLAQFFIKTKKYESAMQHLLFNCRYDPASKILSSTISNLLHDKNCPDPISYCQRILAVDPKNETALNYIRTKR